MIYQEKTSALKPGQVNHVERFPARLQSAIVPANHKEARIKGRPAAPPLSLFNKVREYQSAAQVRATGLYPYFRTISSAQDTEVIMEGKKSGHAGLQ